MAKINGTPNTTSKWKGTQNRHLHRAASGHSGGTQDRARQKPLTDQMHGVDDDRDHCASTPTYWLTTSRLVRPDRAIPSAHGNHGTVTSNFLWPWIRGNSIACSVALLLELPTTPDTPASAESTASEVHQAMRARSSSLRRAERLK